MKKKLREKKQITHKVVRRINGKSEVRFVALNVVSLDKAFTKKNNLPKFTHLHQAYQSNIVEQIKEIGWMGSLSIMNVFPELERSTIGQLIRHYS